MGKFWGGEEKGGETARKKRQDWGTLVGTDGCSFQASRLASLSLLGFLRREIFALFFPFSP